MYKCKFCGKPFSRMKKYHGVEPTYCSRSCSGKDQHRGTWTTTLGEWKVNSGSFKKGITPWNKGIKCPQLSGAKQPNWKGEGVSYRNLHRWVERNLGKAKKCSIDPNHSSPRFHWANISQTYKRDLNDFRELCASCNMKEKVRVSI